MYGLAICGTCGRARVIDRTSKSSSCPYCGNTERTDRMVFIFECADQQTAREALGRAAGFDAPDDSGKKERIENADPYSTMIYRYEHCSDLDEKLQILAEGLTEVKGTFTIDDIRDIVGDKHAEKYVSAMLDRCYAFEVKVGRYKA